MYSTSVSVSGYRLGNEFSMACPLRLLASNFGLFTQLIDLRLQDKQIGKASAYSQHIHNTKTLSCLI